VLKKGVVLSFFLFQAATLFSRTINVPNDFLTIKSAVAASRNGDVVEVEDGIYFEKNIIIDKDIVVKAKNLLGAIVYGTANVYECIFMIRAKAEIAGFVLNNSYDGILQRGSPDVAWRGHDLVIMNMRRAAASINALEGNIGSAYLENILVDRCAGGISTNDANTLFVRKTVFLNCRSAFAGFDHISFKVEQVSTWNCPVIADAVESGSVDSVLPPRATNRIILGRDVRAIEMLPKDRKAEDVYRFFMKTFEASERGKPWGKQDSRQWERLIKKITADVCSAEGDRKSARAYYRDAISLDPKKGYSETTLEALFNLALLSEREMDYDAAIDYYKKAVDEIDIVIDRLPFKYLQAGFFDDKIEIYEALLSRLYQMKDQKGRHEAVMEAFRYSEKSKSIGLLKSLFESPREKFDPIGAELESRGIEISREIARLQILLHRSDISPADKRMTMEKLEAAEDEYRSFLIQKRKNGQRPGRVIQSVHYERLREKLLKEDTALVEYFVGKKRAFAFFMSGASEDMAVLPDPNSLNSMVSNYFDFLSLENSGEFLGMKGARILSDLLIKPFSRSLTPKIKKIVIIPDGFLNYLPFETLVRSSGGVGEDIAGKRSDRTRYLIEDFEISYAPSAFCLIQLQERARPADGNPDILIVANSGKGKSDESLVDLLRSCLPLDFAESEALAIAAHFGTAKKTILIDTQATEDDLKNRDLSLFRIIHFATHGLIDERYWWRSSLLLNRNKSGFEDGFLQPLDIMNLRLEAEMVVLSACRTGSGRYDRGEGLMGLANSFLISGANAVLSSLWKIEDRSSAFFMDKYYYYLAQGDTIGRALRRAKLDMLKSGYSHPRYWAPFVLSGNPASHF